MPIRPENRDRYPADWPAISRAAKDAAGWRCACRGECGRGTHTGRCPNVHGKPAYGTGSEVVLTTAHLNHTPEDCRPENLVPMCQGCHLHYDRDHHRQTAAATRRAAIEAGGQLTLGGFLMAALIVALAAVCAAVVPWALFPLFPLLPDRRDRELRRLLAAEPRRTRPRRRRVRPRECL